MDRLLFILCTLGRRVRYSVGIAACTGLLLTSCCPKDPTCLGQTSIDPGVFWHPKDDILACPCEYPWEVELASTLDIIRKPSVQVADLIDVALFMNPLTQQTWANARAAAYQVEIARSALYPTVTLDSELMYMDTEFDDVNPVSAVDLTSTATNDCLPGAFNLHRFLLGRGLDVIPLASLINENNNVDVAVTDPSLVVGDTAMGIGPSRTLTHNMALSYLLLDFGGRQATIEAAKQALYASNWTHNRQIQQVIIGVLQAYYAYMGVSYLLEARYSDLKNAQKNYEAAQAQFEVGIRNKLDVLQTKTELISFELAIADLKGQKEIIHGQLAKAMGLQANTEFQLPDIPAHLPIDVVTEQVDALIEEAKKNRPDLAAAYAFHAQTKAQVIVARSQGLPTLNTSANLEEFNDLMNPSFNTHSISGAFTINVPLFSGFLYMNQERQAREYVRAACANIRNVEINIALEVMTSYFSFKTAVENLHYSQEFLKFSEEAYEAAFLTYREGLGTILDVLSAQRTLANARAQQIQARTRWAIALSNISFAVGTTGTDKEIKPWKQREK